MHERLLALRSLEPGPSGKPLTPQRRGYCLEALIHDAFDEAQLAPRASYKTDGEQVDGSFVIDGRAMLIEAKWVQKELAASSIYAFKGKVDGRLVGTVGLMLAINGFSEDAVDALTRGKEVNVVLATGDELVVALEGQNRVAEMIRYKLRGAADSAAVLHPFDRATATDSRLGNGASESAPRGGAGTIIWVVEGPPDAAVIEELTRRILVSRQLTATVEVHVGMGVQNSARVASAFRLAYAGEALVGVVVDADGEDPDLRQARIASETAVVGLQISIVAVPPTLEDGWLGIGRTDVSSPQEYRRLIEHAAKTVDINELEEREPSFARFADFVRAHGK